MRRLTEPFGKAGLTVAALALAFLLVPAAQALANGTATVEIEGSGSGEVIATNQSDNVPFEQFETTPPIVCSYASPGPATGTCAGEMPKVSSFGEREGVALKAIPSPGSAFVEWTITEGVSVNELFGEEIYCRPGSEPRSELEEINFPGGERVCWVFNESSTEFGSGEDVKVVAKFSLAAEEFPLTINTAGGTGAGQVNCEVNGGPTVDEPCAAEYPEGTELKLIPVEEPGSEFTGFENGSGSAAACTGTGPCSFEITEASEVDAPFDLIPKFKLTVTKSGTGAGKVTSSPAGIDCGVDCEEEYEEGAVVILTATKSAGSEFKGWTGCKAEPAGKCEVEMSAAKAVDAKFDLIPKFKLTVTKSGTGTGKVTSSPAGIDCGATCEAEFEEGKEVTLTPTAESGSEFKEWTGACTGSGACKVTMSAARAVNAKFDLKTHTLTVNKVGSGSGSVTCDGGACASSYPEGTKVTLGATAASGSSFAGWSGGGCSGTGSCVVTMSADTAVTATFNANPPPPPPAEEKCVVPKLKGKSLSRAKSALTRAHCKLGKVAKPKSKKGPFVVKSSKPGAGTSLPADSKVNLKLAPKPKRK
jgi:hypothetical protein